MKKNISFRFFTILMMFVCNSAFGQIKTESFEFIHNGKKLSGLLDLPTGQTPTSIILIIQGYGKSNIVEGNGYYNLRSNFVKLGLACVIWDKPGCGKSEGDFDINQTVQSSADEVLAAIKEIEGKNIAGANNIGLWGISRAGWICPLVIEQYPKISYWISVSGTDDKESFGYLLETNLRIESRSETDIQLLISEWKRGNYIFRKGGTFTEHEKATQNLRRDPFWIFLNSSSETKESYLSKQKQFISEGHMFDKRTGLMIYVPNFRKTLMKIQCPVLAIFGEKDTNVNWRQTIALYKETIGKKTKANLTIKTFPDCNHNLKSCKTGGMKETIENSNKSQPPCDGYFEAMSEWLNKVVLSK